MQSIEAAVGEIRAAVRKVHDVMGAKTWVGSAADRWGGDFNGRMGVLGRLFDSFPPEEHQLIVKAQRDQEARDRRAGLRRSEGLSDLMAVQVSGVAVEFIT